MNDYYNELMDEGFGPSACCENGKQMYRGGSMYYCNQCGKEIVRAAHGFAKYPIEKKGEDHEKNR